ncbi:MAG: hypothetical protein V3V34_11765 [Kiloniellales bacterium]
MTFPVKITDHTARGRAFILSQFDGSPRIQRIATIMQTRVQETEDLCWDFLQEQLLAVAVGVHLERLGRKIGELRGPFSDDTVYRRIILARVLANISEGLYETLIGITDLVMQDFLTGTLPDVRVFQIGRAHVRIEFDVTADPGDDLKTKLLELIPLACAGGVSCRIIMTFDPPFTYNIGPGYNVGRYATVLL